MRGEIVVVTGGASGIGHACCLVLAKKAWKVVVSDVDEIGAKRVAIEVGGIASAMDVGSDAACRPRRSASSGKSARSTAW